MVIAVLAVLGIGGFAWYRFRASDEQQETVRGVAANAAGAVASAWEALVDKIRSIRYGGLAGKLTVYDRGGRGMG